MERPETGPMQFGDDWPGVFLRGDAALGYGIALDVILATTEFGGLGRVQLTGLLSTLRSCDARTDPAVARAVLVTPTADGSFRFRVRFRVLGGHVHCRVFQRQLPGETWQKNGDLVFDTGAWTQMQMLLRLVGCDVLGEEDTLDGSTFIPDCECRSCGHPASRHRGESGACVAPGCECGPGGWS